MKYKLKEHVTDEMLIAVGFDRCGNRATNKKNCIHVSTWDKSITYGTWTHYDLFKVNKKHIQDLIDLGYVEEVK